MRCIVCNAPSDSQYQSEGYEACCEQHLEMLQREQTRLAFAKQKDRKRGNIHILTLEEWFWTLRFFEFTCVYCGGPFEQMDHCQPLSKRGKSAFGNCVPSCASDNDHKGAMRRKMAYHFMSDEHLVRFLEFEKEIQKPFEKLLPFPESEYCILQKEVNPLEMVAQLIEPERDLYLDRFFRLRNAKISKKEMAKRATNQIVAILEKEHIVFEKDDVLQLVKKTYWLWERAFLMEEKGYELQELREPQC